MPFPESATPLADAAAQLHEMFATLIAAGFTEDQALYLVANMIGSITDG